MPGKEAIPLHALSVRQRLLAGARRRRRVVDVVGVATGDAADCRQLPVERRQLGGDAYAEHRG
jgi:hypothetical protein